MIQFQKIRFKNFGSFGNYFTEIVFDKSRTTLVCGTNGSGKSFALLDSLTFVLFGKPFRKINIPQIQNSINTKECIVEVYFTIGKDQYKIRRGLAPKIFEIFKNNELINQDAKTADYQALLEEQIIKMNYKTFTQVVILGSSSFVPFMQLTASDRRAVIENILDINIFSVMNTLLKGKLTILKENLKEVSNKIDNQKQKIEYQNKLIQKTKTSAGYDPTAILIEIEQFEKQYNEILHEINILNSEIEFIGNTNEIEKEKNKLNKFISQLDVKIEQLTEEKSFYEKEENCSKCKSSITKEIKEKNLTEIEENLHKNKQAEETFKVLQEEVEKKLTTIKKYNEQILSLQNKLNICDYNLKHKKKIYKEIENNDIEIKKEEILLEEYKCELKKLEEEKELKKEDYLNHEHAYEILRDGGVKSKIIKHYLPSMNKHINKFLSTMGFFAQFNLDEDFNETIKSRYRDEFSYMNFSEGEKMRIDIALLLAWREIAKLKNSVNCNLLILDEIFDSSLDTGGTDEIMKLLNNMGQNTNVFVISHKADQIIDKFSNILSFEKKNNFSKLLKA